MAVLEFIKLVTVAFLAQTSCSPTVNQTDSLSRVYRYPKERP